MKNLPNQLKHMKTTPIQPKTLRFVGLITMFASIFLAGLTLAMVYDGNIKAAIVTGCVAMGLRLVGRIAIEDSRAIATSNRYY